MTVAFPPETMLLAPWLTSRSIALLHSYRGLGKTHVALGIAVAVASGGAFLRWTAPKPARVVYIDGEMGGAAIQKRLAAMDNAAAAGDNLAFVLPNMQPDCKMPDIATPEGRQRIEDVLGDVDALILDNLATLSSADENERDGWLSVQDWLIKLRHRGLAVLAVHHDGKALTQRGHSSREDVLQTVIHLTRPSDYSEDQGARFVVRFSKARELYGQDAKPFEAWLKPDDFGLSQWTTADVGTKEHPQTDAVNAMLAAGASWRDIQDKLGVSSKTVSRIARETQANAEDE